MKQWRLTPCAEESLVDIFTWTIKNFGERQALAYRDGLIARINKLASGALPHGRSCAALMQGRIGAESLTYYREGGHYIIMRDTDELLEVLEFFHQSSDISNQLIKLTSP